MMVDEVVVCFCW